MIVVGLTGSIGMGKSTTAQMFRELGAPVFDADAAVHALYAPGGAGAAAVAALLPNVLTPVGAVDRAALAAKVKDDPSLLARLEAAIHPLVRAAQGEFLDEAAQSGAPLAILDVPLLIETGQHRLVDAVIVVSAPAAIQRGRVLARPGMTPAKFDQLLARQISDAAKRTLADFVIDSSSGLDSARAQVAAIVTALKDRHKKAMHLSAQ